MKQDDHGAGGFVNDLADQGQRMIRARAEADERHIRAFSRRDGADVLDLGLARDHLVAQLHDDTSDDGEAVLALVGDQHAQMVVRAMLGARAHDTGCTSTSGLDGIVRKSEHAASTLKATSG